MKANKFELVKYIWLNCWKFNHVSLYSALALHSSNCRLHAGIAHQFCVAQMLCMSCYSVINNSYYAMTNRVSYQL